MVIVLVRVRFAITCRACHGGGHLPVAVDHGCSGPVSASCTLTHPPAE